MKRAYLILLAGLLGGLAAHVLWFELRKPIGPDSGEGDLAWLKSELKLSSEQFSRLQSVHKQNSPHLLALANQVMRLRQEFDAFERTRKEAGEVDFLEFARFVEMRRAVDRECLASKQRLIMASADLMTPDQREKYLSLLDAPPSPQAR